MGCHLDFNLSAIIGFCHWDVFAEENPDEIDKLAEAKEEEEGGKGEEMEEEAAGEAKDEERGEDEEQGEDNMDVDAEVSLLSRLFCVSCILQISWL